MIKSWKVKNFKSAIDLNLELTKLNIFVGENSSGKSTVIQSILLTTQTLQNPIPSKHIVLNGHIYKFGEFLDILSKSAVKPSISIDFELDPLDKEHITSQYHRRLYFDDGDLEKVISLGGGFSFSNHQEVGSLISRIEPIIEESTIFIKLEKTINQISVSKSKIEENERLRRLGIQDKYISERDKNNMTYEVKEESNIVLDDYRYRVPKSAKFIAAELNHFIPSRLIYSYDYVEEMKLANFNQLISPYFFSNFKPDEELNDNVRKYLMNLMEGITNESEFLQFPTYSQEEIKSTLKELKSRFLIENFYKLYENSIFSEILRRSIILNQDHIKKLINPSDDKELRVDNTYYYNVGVEYISNFFKSSVKYLGPLRDEPKPIYPLTTSLDPNDVGYKGENTAAVLELNRKELVNYIPSKAFENTGEQFGYKQAKESVTKATLLTAVLDWLKYVGVAADVDTVDKGKLGHELKISSPGSNGLHDLTHVGVGVSQVLPILISSLLADADSTLIFEQPELHLNPKVQSRLADFFLSMTMLNKQCIVETHSEYLINKLRYFIANSSEDSIKSNSAIFFVEKEQGYSKYKKVNINEYGVIEKWPKGFFDENQTLASDLLKAVIAKKQLPKD